MRVCYLGLAYDLVWLSGLETMERFLTGNDATDSRKDGLLTFHIIVIYGCNCSELPQ
jgi:hypothetical protein